MNTWKTLSLAPLLALSLFVNAQTTSTLSTSERQKAVNECSETTDKVTCEVIFKDYSLSLMALCSDYDFSYQECAAMIGRAPVKVGAKTANDKWTFTNHHSRQLFCIAVYIEEAEERFYTLLPGESASLEFHYDDEGKLIRLWESCR